MLIPRKEVVAAVIERDGRILIAQRGDGKFPFKWEFPGGKIQPGESETEALFREISEELGVSVEIGEKMADLTHDDPELSVRLRFYACTLPEGSEPQAREHLSLVWVKPSEAGTYDFLKADQSVLETIERFFSVRSP